MKRWIVTQLGDPSDALQLDELGSRRTYGKLILTNFSENSPSKSSI